MIDRNALIDARVTLNGKPAVICGQLNDYATVAALPDGPSYEWAWPTVARIVANGGDFRA